MILIIRITKYKNEYIIIEIYNNIIFMIKFLVTIKIFDKIPNCNLENNNKSTNIDLFQKRSIVGVENTFLQNYIC